MLAYQFAYTIILICLLCHIVLPILSFRIVYVYQLTYMFITLSPFPNIIPFLIAIMSPHNN